MSKEVGVSTPSNRDFGLLLNRFQRRAVIILDRWLHPDTAAEAKALIADLANNAPSSEKAPHYFATGPLHVVCQCDPAHAIEQAIAVLNNIVEKHPEVRRDFDCEAFIHHELAPELEAKRAEAWIEEELKDGDKICEAAGVQRTEGGRLQVAKIIAKLSVRPEVAPHNFDPKRDVACTKGEYAQLVHDARRYEWLRDNMRRMPLGGAGTRHFFDQPGTMSFQEAVDEAKAASSPRGTTK